MVAAGCSRENPLFSEVAGDTDSSGAETAASNSGGSGMTQGSAGEGGSSTSATTTSPGTSGGTTSDVDSDPTPDSIGPGVEDVPVEDCAEYAGDCLWIGDKVCGKDHKCVPVGHWIEGQELMCAPIVDDPLQIGDDCTDFCDEWDNNDDCAPGSICHEGKCRELCEPQENDCGDPASCFDYHPAVGLCEPHCDPLHEVDPCAGADTCVPAPDNTWVCIEEMNAGTRGSLCGHYAECTEGFVCLSGVCTTVCSLPSGVGECEEGEVCEPWSVPAPENFNHIGHCALP